MPRAALGSWLVSIAIGLVWLGPMFCRIQQYPSILDSIIVSRLRFVGLRLPNLHIIKKGRKLISMRSIR